MIHGHFESFELSVFHILYELADAHFLLVEILFSSACFPGSEVPLTELAEAIVAPELGGTSSDIHKVCHVY